MQNSMENTAARTDIEIATFEEAQNSNNSNPDHVVEQKPHSTEVPSAPKTPPSLSQTNFSTKEI